MKFSIVNLGCKVNRVEADAFAAELLSLGSDMVQLADADLIIVNTCTVTGEADKKARKAVRHALNSNKHAQVMVTGCAVALDAAVFSQIDERVSIVAKNKVQATLRQLFNNPATCENVFENPLRMGEHFRSRVGVKIQDGCDNACTYCIVHVARGQARSTNIDDVISEVCAYTQAGCKEIVLSGINLGSYHFATFDLVGLLQRLLEETAIIRCDGEPLVRFRLSSIEPLDMTEPLIALIADARGRICRHLHLPLQAGSSKVLADMARPYTADAYMDLVQMLYHNVPQLSLSTDVIVGFPGESEEDFQDTLRVVRSCCFSKIHVFPYSRRTGTPAALRDDQIPSEIKLQRARIMRTCASDLREKDYRRREGSEELALVETDGRALTESYYALPAPTGVRPGSLTPLTFPAFADL